MSKLTQPQQISERLCQGYDPDYTTSVWRKMNYTFGEPWNKNVGLVGGGEGEFPDFPDIAVKFLEVGRSRRILNNQFIGLSRSMYADPQPQFPQVDRWTGEIRKQFYLARYGGAGYGDGEWSDELASAFLDGDGMGAGFVQLGLRTNRKTGFQRVHASYSPLLLTIWDRHERNPARARWIAFIKYVPLDLAEQIWGPKNVHDGKHVRKLFDGVSSTPLDCVRVIEYYDLGYGLKGQPTMAVIPSSFKNEPWSVQPNAFECLPCSYYMHFLAPGMRRPVGRIDLQMATQEALNELEKGLRQIAKRGGFDIVDVSQLDEGDIKKLNNGDPNILIKLKNPRPGVQPFVRVPAKEAANTFLHLKEHYERQFNADSGVTDFDRGVLSLENRTLGENRLVDQRASVQSSWSELQATKMHTRTCNVALKIAEKFDRDPVTLDFFGYNVPINVPEEPRSYISNFLSEPSKIVIGPDSLKAQDIKRERYERLQLLEALRPLVGQTIDPTWFTEKLLENTVDDDPKEALMRGGAQQAMTSMQTQQGMPPL